MELPTDQSRPKRWWQNVWLRAALIHPLLTVPALLLMFRFTGEDTNGSTPPLSAALQLAAASSGTILTFVMVVRRPAIGMNERVILIVASAMATMFVLFGAFIVAQILGRGLE